MLSSSDHGAHKNRGALYSNFSHAMVLHFKTKTGIKEGEMARVWAGWCR